MPAPTAGDARRPRTFMEWCGLACRGSIVRRGLKFAVVVGSILIAINHGDRIVAGTLTRANYVKMGLTVLVPYVVSVLSSVWAVAHQEPVHFDEARSGPE